MNRIKEYMLFSLVAAMVGCSPKVTSEMQMWDFEPQPTNKVMIFGANDDVPAEAKAIGRVFVDGKGASVRKQYGKMLNLAVKETARKGGNVLVIDTVDVKNNCVKSTVAYVDGMLADSLTISDRRVRQLLKMKTIRRKPSVQQMNAAQQQAIISGQEEQRQQEMEMLAQASINQDNYVEDDSWESESKPVKVKEIFKVYSLRVAAGPMWTTSRIYYPNGSHGSGMRGFGMALSYTMAGDNFWGIGLDAQHIRTRVRQYKTDWDYKMTYVGPCFVAKHDFSESFRLYSTIGLGVSLYKDYEGSEVGFGSRYDLGVEYLLTKHLSVGADFVYLASRFNQSGVTKNTDGSSIGINNLGLMATLRYNL